MAVTTEGAISPFPLVRSGGMPSLKNLETRGLERQIPASWVSKSLLLMSDFMNNKKRVFEQTK